MAPGNHGTAEPGVGLCDLQVVWTYARRLGNLFDEMLPGFWRFAENGGLRNRMLPLSRDNHPGFQALRVSPWVTRKARISTRPLLSSPEDSERLAENIERCWIFEAGIGGW